MQQKKCLGEKADQRSADLGCQDQRSFWVIQSFRLSGSEILPG